MRASIRLIAMALVALVAVSAQAQEFGAWKEKAKIKLAGPISLAILSDDKAQVVTVHETTGKVFTGGLVPKVFQMPHLQVHAAASGAKLFNVDLAESGWLLAFRSGRLAYTEALADKVVVVDCNSWNKLATFECRNPTDSPPGAAKNVPKELEDLSGGGRISDLEFSRDAKYLAVARMESGDWKMNGKGAWTGSSYEQVVLWDVEKSEKAVKLDYRSEKAATGHLSLIGGSDRILARFEDGLRIIDVAKKEWTPIAVPSAVSSSITGDGKLIAVSGNDNTVRIIELETKKEIASFQEKNMLKAKATDPNFFGLVQLGPIVEFVNGDRTLKVTLNDGKTTTYRDLKGVKLASAASDNLKLTGRVLAISKDRTMAITCATRTSPTCSVMVRDILPSGSSTK